MLAAATCRLHSMQWQVLLHGMQLGLSGNSHAHIYMHQPCIDRAWLATKAGTHLHCPATCMQNHSKLHWPEWSSLGGWQAHILSFPYGGVSNCFKHASHRLYTHPGCQNQHLYVVQQTLARHVSTTFNEQCQQFLFNQQ